MNGFYSTDFKASKYFAAGVDPKLIPARQRHVLSHAKADLLTEVCVCVLPVCHGHLLHHGSASAGLPVT